MRLLRSGSRVPVLLGWVAAGVVGVGLLAGGAWYAASQSPTPSLLESLTGRASAQEAGATPQTTQAQTTQPQPVLPTAGNSARPTGQVTQITADPATFTLRAADGTLTTYRVLDYHRLHGRPRSPVPLRPAEGRRSGRGTRRRQRPGTRSRGGGNSVAATGRRGERQARREAQRGGAHRRAPRQGQRRGRRRRAHRATGDRAAGGYANRRPNAAAGADRPAEARTGRT